MVSPSEVNGFLQQAPLFQGLEVDVLERIQQAGVLRKVSTGSFFFLQGDPAGMIFVLVQGRIRLGQVTAEGQEVLMRLAGAGTLFGAVALTQNETYPVSAQAAEDSAALGWTKAVLMEFVLQTPLMAMNAMHMMAGHVQEFQNRYRELATERVERRLARAILRLASQSGRRVPEGVQIDLPVTRQDLADMTGTTIYTVSRILSQWETQGLVLGGRERVVIRFPHGLVRIAEDLPGENQ